MNLFDDPVEPVNPQTVPLPERMRPRRLDEVVGQDEIIGPGRPLREMIERDLLQSIILWGPPGTGKTTLARLIADATNAEFVAFSADRARLERMLHRMAGLEDGVRDQLTEFSTPTGAAWYYAPPSDLLRDLL